MKPAVPDESEFLPCTRNVDVGDGVMYRPIRSWHGGTFAGEQLGPRDAYR